MRNNVSKKLSLVIAIFMITAFLGWDLSTTVAQEVQLAWSPSTSSNVMYYNIYRSTNNDSSFVLLYSVDAIDTNYTDSDVEYNVPYYYVATAEDQFGNESGFSNMVDTTLTVFVMTDIKIFLEGPYDDGMMSTLLYHGGVIPLSQPFSGDPWNYTGTETVTVIPDLIVDWVMVELRTNVEASTTVASRAGFLKNDGLIVDLDGTSLLNFNGISPGNYYLVIYHRNHLSVMSTAAVPLDNDSATLYDFTIALDQYYQNDAAVLEDGVYGMYAGDANGNGQIQNSDKVYWMNQVGLAGYKGADCNLNVQVQNTDKINFWMKNVGKGTQVLR